MADLSIDGSWRIRSILETFRQRDRVSDGWLSDQWWNAIKADPKLVEQMNAIEEDLYQIRNRSGQDPLNFPIKLNNRIASLPVNIHS